MITFTFGTVASANAATSSPTDFAIIFSLHKVAMKPVAFVSVSTGISKASQNFTKSAAFLAPLAEMLPSNVSVFLPSASYTSLLFATAPTVAPFKRIKPVTMSFA